MAATLWPVIHFLQSTKVQYHLTKSLFAEIYLILIYFHALVSTCPKDFSVISLLWTSKGAFTPDANEALHANYLHVKSYM